MPGHPSPEPIPQNNEPQGSLGHRNRADWGRGKDQQRPRTAEGRHEQRDGDERTRPQHVGHVQRRGGKPGKPSLQVRRIGGRIGLYSHTRVLKLHLPVDQPPDAG